MKKITTVLLALLLLSVVVLSGCEVVPSVSQEPIPSYNVIQQEDPYQWIEENDQYADLGYNTNNLVSVDEFGRVSMTALGQNDEKTIGIFGHMGEGFFKSSIGSSIYDVSKIIEQYGADKVFKQHDRISPNNKSHYWGEPLWGYYDSGDPYVINKQLEMYIAMGIDYLVLDVTNGWIFEENTLKLMDKICQLRADGWDAPQVVFYVHSMNNKTVRELYQYIYTSHVEYEESWYKTNGKPTIIAYTETAKDIAEAGTRGITDFSDGTYADLSKEILDFFFFVEPRWPNDGVTVGMDSPIYDKIVDGRWQGYSWIEWAQPLRKRQTSLGDYMNVAVASHPNIPFSFSITRGVINWGRNYDIKNNRKTEDGLYTGTYYQSCWDQVFEKQPDTIMLVAWNAWTALKSEWAGEYMMCDVCDFEYSLSIEPANGYYKDSYLLQTSQNSRNFKYLEGRQTYYGNNIDINGTVAQWYNVEAVYRQVGTASYGRDYMSSDGKKYHYVVDAPKNNIQEVRVVHDISNIYMMVRCGDTITEQSGESWMNILLSAGNPDINNGWEGYSYVINRKPIADGKTTVEKLDDNGNGTAVGTADIVVRGEFMFLKIPRKTIDMMDTQSLYFKVADSVESVKDIMSYYTTGSTFPIGRYSYSYTGK